MRSEIEDYVAGLGLDAYLVGGAVRDELLGLDSKDADFLVPGLDIDGLLQRLATHGRAEELVVAGRPVGVRFYPREREIRRIAPAGIEFAPPRREQSTGPGRHDFEIVVDPNATIEDDLARRDFTVNAMARHLGNGEVIDPHGGRDDIQRRVLRTVSPRSFAEDPLRLVRGLRFVSQLGFDPDGETVRQMRDEAGALGLVSAERIGGGLAADGMGELSKLLLGHEPAKALRLARDTGVLVALLPEFAPAIGFDPKSDDHDLTLDEHVFAVVQAASELDKPLRVRLATLFHDLGKPGGAEDHAAAGAEITDAVMLRLRYPNELRHRVVRIVRFHPFHLRSGDDLEARHLLAQHGEGLVLDLLDHWDADLRGRDDTPRTREKLAQAAHFRHIVERERSSPHKLSDLAVDGTDLIELGYHPGPALGRTLDELLDAVVEDPSLNRRELLLKRARRLLVE